MVPTQTTTYISENLQKKLGRKGGSRKLRVILLRFLKKTRSTPTIFLYMLFMLQTLH